LRVLAVLALLPLLTYPLVGYAVRPARPVFAPVRLASVRAALILGGGAVVVVEALSAGHALTRGPLVACWGAGLMLAGGAAAWRYRRDGTPIRWWERARQAWREAPVADRVMVVALVGLLLAELVLALGYPPNNYDSQTYHLPKIEHWAQQHDVNFFASRIHRQLSLAPGAEYLLLHLRVLTGGDVFYNLLQWLAGAACALLASRIAGQLGGAARAQLISAFLVATTPIVALEATSTQTDLVVAAWVACVATLVLDQLRRRTGPTDVLLLGAATGLTALTKATGLLAAGPLLLIWLAAQVRLARGGLARRLPATVLAGLGIVAVAVVIAGPYVNRVDDFYGNPLGPPYLRESISMQRHDPAAVLVNALRIAQNALQPPSNRVNSASGKVVDHIARWVHVNPNDPKITFPDSTFPAPSWKPDEDHASFPITAVLVLIAAAVLTIRPRWVAGADRVPARAYALAFWASLLLYVATVKWQPWGNRLILFVFVVGAPLAGLWLSTVFQRAGRTATRPAPARWRLGAAGLAAAALLAAGTLGWLAVGYGWPRRLVGPGAVFTQSRMQAQFNRRPEWLASYERAAAAVRASGATRIGLVQEGNSWEYPWWVLLPGRTIVSMQTLVPALPGAKANSVQAIVCAAPAGTCRYYMPHDWHLHMGQYNIGYALPPGSDTANQSGG
jgi:hypothetical protein